MYIPVHFRFSSATLSIIFLSVAFLPFGISLLIFWLPSCFWPLPFACFLFACLPLSNHCLPTDLTSRLLLSALHFLKRWIVLIFPLCESCCLFWVVTNIGARFWQVRRICEMKKKQYLLVLRHQFWYYVLHRLLWVRQCYNDKQLNQSSFFWRQIQSCRLICFLSERYTRRLSTLSVH